MSFLSFFRWPFRLLLALALGACAQVTTVPEGAGQSASPTAAVEDSAEKAPIQPPVLPNRELTQDILYEYLTAEIAGQRGKLGLATQSYLDLAKTTRDPRIARRATEVALYARLPAYALQSARIWLETDPYSVQAQQTVTALLVENGKLDEARPYIEKLLVSDAANVGGSFLQLNGLLARHGDKTAVLDLVQQLAKPYSNLPEAHFAIGQAAWNAGNAELSLAEVREALHLSPQWELAALFQAQILQKSSAGDALGYMKGYLQQYPMAKDVRLNYARLLVAEKSYSEARNQFEQLVKDYPANPDVKFTVGLLSLQLNDYDTAAAVFKQVLVLDYKDKDSVRLYLGQIAEERKNYDDALAWYGSVGPGEQQLTAQIKYASLLSKRSGLEAGREYLKKVPVQNSQQRIQIMLAEAQLLRDAKHYQESFNMLAGFVGEMPDQPDLLYDYAMAAEKVDRIDILEQNLRKLIQLKPDYAHAYNALGYTLADRNERLAEALQFIQQALKLSPDDPFIIDSMGWVLYRLGKAQEGLDYLKRAFDAKPDPEIAAHLGEVLWVQGQRLEAEKIWRSALKHNPENEVLQEVVKKFLP